MRQKYLQESVAINEVSKLEAAGTSGASAADRRWIKADRELDYATTKLLTALAVSPITIDVKMYVQGYEIEESE
jgi:hypothetical protein